PPPSITPPIASSFLSIAGGAFPPRHPLPLPSPPLRFHHHWEGRAARPCDAAALPRDGGWRKRGRGRHGLGKEGRASVRPALAGLGEDEDMKI
ncbi:unnamed protein product, partial [Urochloa humidicola]